MGNWTHYTVLTKKNFITLKRNYGFAICFALLPLITMGIFAILIGLIGKGYTDPQNNYNNLYWTTTRQPVTTSGFYFGENPEISSQQLSSLINCQYWNLYNFALVGSQENLAYFADLNATLQAPPYNLQTKIYDTIDEVNEIVKNEKTDTFCFAVQIDTIDLATDTYSFHVSWLRNNIPDTNNAAYDENVKTPDYTNWNKVKNYGFLGIYYLLVQGIQNAKIQNGEQLVTDPPINIDLAYVPMKTPRYFNLDPQVTQQLGLQFPFFMMFTFLIPLYYMVSKLAEEKETKSREGMKMMGLKDSTYFFSWMTTFAVVIALMSLLLTIMISFSTFKQSNKVLFFLFNFIYGISLFGFSVLIVALLPTQRSSSLAASLLHVITFFIVFAIADPKISSSVKIGLSVFPNVAMALGFFNLFYFEYQSTGLSWAQSSIWYGNFTFTAGILMLTFDVFLYLFLGLYLDAIIPSQYGVAKKWNFICTRGFWCGAQRRQQRASQLDQNQLLEEDDEAKNPQDFEQVAANIKRQEESNECLKIRGLRKEFGKKIAVDNTSMTMYQGQIFALLGHNGAGKTTTISMLTGLFEPSKGKASVYNIDIFDEMDEMRKILGVCPQHDVLFEYLTPREHLALFAAFKQTPAAEIQNQVEKMIKEIDLVTVQNQIAKTLSGGQKRKLSVGCSMIGNSKIVILDEPTSGMDTTSRRRLWEMLKANKNGKIIILTTHYMDEADILGDRIAIMAEGKVKCCGSSLFLKNRYGVGYNLVIAKKNRNPAPQVDEFIFSRIDDVKKLQEVSSEMNFQLPTSSSGQFKEFFEVFDRNLDALGIRSYGVGITTLEEVFLKIGRGSEEEEQEDKEELKRFTLAKLQNEQNKVKKDSQIQKNSPENSLNKASMQLEDYSIAEEHETGTINVFWLNLSVLLKKKFLLQIREPKTFFIEILFPIIFIFAGLALASIQIFKEGHPTDLSLEMFPSPNYIYYNSPTQNFANSQNFVKTYFDNSLWPSTSNLPIWSNAQEMVTIDNTQDLETMVNTLDNFMFDDAYSKGRVLFGNYFYYQNLQTQINVINYDKLNPIKQIQAQQYSAVCLINVTSQDAVLSFSHAIHETFLRDFYKNQKLSFTVIMTPFPVTALEQGVINAAAGTSSSILIAIAYMMVSNSLIQNIIMERKRNVKHQMIISGVSIPAYWISHYIIDLVFQAIPSAFIVIGMPQVWVVVIVFIFANPVFVYFFSFLFENEGTASILTRLIYLLTGSILPIAVSILAVIPSTVEIGKVLRWFFYILPIFALNFGVINISNRKVVAAATDTPVLNPLDNLVAGPSVYFLIADTAIFWIIIALFENGYVRMVTDWFQRRRRPAENVENSLMQQQEDEDVVEEEARVESVEPSSQAVRLVKIRKTYGTSMAVDKVSFGLEYGECFALLGVSGAGKTTSFKCLTGEEKPTEGIVQVNGFDVNTKEGFNNARRLIGYCPQFDAIFDGLTVREHLEFYANVKGVIGRIRRQIVEKQMLEMDLMEFQNVRAETLSGGNKRKLSVAIAMIGNPPIVFLDEPSTGVDPKAKRFMWSIVSKISTQRKKSSVIITTHSMEEAEALCTKMGIMVAGRFKCFGSSQHIKDKFGTGYEIEVKIRTLNEQEIENYKREIGLNEPITGEHVETVLAKMNAGHISNEIKQGGLGDEFFQELKENGRVNYDDLIKWAFTETRAMIVLDLFESMFKQVEVLEHYYNSYLIKVSRDSFSIGYLFGMMEDNKVKYDISEYSVSQTTLEQIFNNFAKEAEKNNPRRRTTLNRLTNGRNSQPKGKNGEILRLDTERGKTVALDKTGQ